MTGLEKTLVSGNSEAVGVEIIAGYTRSISSLTKWGSSLVNGFEILPFVHKEKELAEQYVVFRCSEEGHSQIICGIDAVGALISFLKLNRSPACAKHLSVSERKFRISR